MRAIGFGVAKKVGKDTAVRLAMSYLRQEYPKVKTERRGFSDAIKENAHRMYHWGGLQDCLYYDQHHEEEDIVLPAIGRTPRQIWDELGSLCRNISDKTWPELAFYDLDCDVVLFDGVRSLNEIKYIRDFGGKVYKMEREAAPKSNHIVDHLLDDFHDWDGIIINNGSIRDLNTHIKKIIDDSMKEWNFR